MIVTNFSALGGMFFLESTETYRRIPGRLTAHQLNVVLKSIRLFSHEAVRMIILITTRLLVQCHIQISFT